MDSSKQVVEVAAAAPLAEMVIRVGDTRPVVITMGANFQKTGEVKFSPGPFEDILLARWVLTFMSNAVGDELYEREKKVISGFVAETEVANVDVDDIPF